MQRKILHVDLDAFFAAVEELDHPEYRGKPLIIGGTGRRGVVSTCNYEARKYGVHSAMPGFKAKQLCPHGIFVRGNMERYKEMSDQVFDILYGITDNIQPVSIDEAYLDITDLYQSPEYVARYIKETVFKDTGLTISVGISYNKFLAKLSSEWNKPDGLYQITPDMMPDVLKPLSISKVHGLGKKSAAKLNRIGIYTIGDLLKFSKEDLVLIMGSWGGEIYEKIRGLDDRPVRVERERKSIGRETTLREDVSDVKVLEDYIRKFSAKVASDLARKNMEARTVTIKYKTFEFEGHTKSKTLGMSVYLAEDIEREALALMKTITFDKAVRLIGLSLSGLTPMTERQMTLFD